LTGPIPYVNWSLVISKSGTQSKRIVHREGLRVLWLARRLDGQDQIETWGAAFSDSGGCILYPSWGNLGLICFLFFGYAELEFKFAKAVN
jgi:hypothetical protein